MSLETFRFRDNVFVRSIRSKYSSTHYLSIIFREYDPDYPESRQLVELTCYMLPGRLDVYSFDFAPGGSGYSDHLRFSSENGHTSMSKALKLVESDLNKDNVVKMLVDAIRTPKHLRYSRILVGEILSHIGKNTKSYRACKRALEKRELEWRKECEDRRMQKKIAFINSIRNGGIIFIHKNIDTPKGKIEAGSNVKVISISKDDKFVNISLGSRKGQISVNDAEPQYIPPKERKNV